MRDDCREDIQHRLRSIEGHVRGVQRMLSEEKGCLALLRQVKALQRSLDKIVGLLLYERLNEIASSGLSQRQAQQAAAEISEILAASRSMPATQLEPWGRTAKPSAP